MKVRMKDGKPLHLPIGTISHGTLKNDDLFEAFSDAADGLRLSRADRTILREMLQHDHVKLQDHTDEDCLDSDIEALTEMLDRYTPTYCYFGTNEGDGSDFGVWPSDEVPFHSGPTDDIGKGVELPPCNAEFPDHFLIVNDHGNATLYRKQRQGRNHRWVECWSVV